VGGGGGQAGTQDLKYVCSSSIATPNVKGIIGRRIRNNANNAPPSYATRRCSRTHRRRRTVPFASCQCQYFWYVVFRFHPRLQRPCQLVILRLPMRSVGKEGHGRLLSMFREEHLCRVHSLSPWFWKRCEVPLLQF